MGEYTKRANGDMIKIGTNEIMYYLRYDQRNMVSAENLDLARHVESLWFRLPRAEEAENRPGDFEFSGPCGAKPIDLYGPRAGDALYMRHRDNLAQFAARRPGLIQLRTDNGIVVNVPCGHGHFLDLPKGMGYNGHVGDELAAFAVGMRAGAPAVLVGCRYCRTLLAWYGRDEFCSTLRPFSYDLDAYKYLVAYLAKMAGGEI